jgi:TrmH family RNA methyltransferase
MKSISSRENVLFKQLKRLAGSSRERRKQGQTLLDGLHLLEAYHASGAVAEQVLVTESALAQTEIQAFLAQISHWQIFTLADALFAEISPVDTPTGILAAIRIGTDTRSGDNDFVLLLEDIQDPGNLGAILRSAAAAGVTTAHLSTACADVWSPKVLRGGMGAHFNLTIIERADLLQVTQRFQGLSLATMPAAELSIYALDLTGAVALLVGNEGAGLSLELQAAASHRVHIPMRSGVESLNVAGATAVCLFERVRQRLACQ